jgi:hypothetical protein
LLQATGKKQLALAQLSAPDEETTFNAKEGTHRGIGGGCLF